MIQALAIISVTISTACALCASISITVIVGRELHPNDLMLMLYTTLSFVVAAVAMAVIAGLLWPS